jgi:chromosome segregation ATPase
LKSYTPSEAAKAAVWRVEKVNQKSPQYPDLHEIYIKKFAHLRADFGDIICEDPEHGDFDIKNDTVEGMIRMWQVAGGRRIKLGRRDMEALTEDPGGFASEVKRYCDVLYAIDKLDATQQTIGSYMSKFGLRYRTFGNERKPEKAHVDRARKYALVNGKIDHDRVREYLKRTRREPRIRVKGLSYADLVNQCESFAQKIRDLEKKYRQAQGAASRAAKKTKKILNTKEGLHTQIKQIRKDKLEYLENKIIAERSTKKLRKEYNGIKGQNAALKRQYDRLQERHNKLQEQAAESEQQKEELEEKLAEAAKQSDALQRQLAKASLKYSKLEETLSKLQKQYQQSQKAISSFQAQKDKLYEQIASLRETISETGGANKTLEKQVATLSAQIINLQTQYADALAKTDSSTKDAITKLTENYQAQLKDLKAQIQNLKTQGMHIKKQKDIVNKKYRAAQAQIIKLKQQLTAKASEPIDVTQTREYRALETRNYELTGEIGELQRSLVKQKELRKLENKERALEEKVTKETNEAPPAKGRATELRERLSRTRNRQKYRMNGSYKKRQKIIHDTFGKGTVTEVNPFSMEVDFDNLGSKTLVHNSPKD